MINTNKYIYDFVTFHIKDIYEINQIEKIRQIRVLKEKRWSNILKKNVFLLWFYSNDWINFLENNITIYVVYEKESNNKYLIAILIKYYDDGTKSETLLYHKKISNFLVNLLKSKYDLILKSYY